MREEMQSPSFYSFWQKTVFFVIIPLIYTVILVAVLMTIFNHGDGTLSAKLVNMAKQVPGINKVLPAIVSKQTDPTNAMTAADTTQSLTKQLQDSKQTIQDQQKQINQVQDDAKKKDDSNQTMQKQIQDLNNQLTTKQQDEEELKQKANDLAAEYGSMKPKQAAAILDTMSVKDAAYALSAMKVAQRAGILDLMDPKKAADITMALNDFTMSKDNEIASLQQKLQEVTSGTQSLDELVKTYAQMPPQNAATLIEEIMKTDSKKAIQIVSSMDSATSAKILSAMSSGKKNPEAVKQAVQITKSLML